MRDSHNTANMTTIEVVVDFAYSNAAMLHQHNAVHKMMALIKILIHVLNSIDLTGCAVQWSITFDATYEQYSTHHLNTSEAQLLFIADENLPIPAQSTLLSAIPILEQMLEAKPEDSQQIQWKTRWKTYEKIHAICNVFREMDLQKKTRGADILVDYEDDLRSENGRGSSSMLIAAQRALESKDDDRLALLLRDMKTMLKTFLHPLNRIIALADDEKLPPNITNTLRFAKPDIKRRPNWPATREHPVLGDVEPAVEDFVFEKYDIDGQISYRLITPSIVSSAAFKEFRIFSLAPCKSAY